ncbi:uncharacterized protein [Elaeis guineensis]|uniref:uncharacterized protein isoform X2 n=1 Tax=Elaeis guineensis var. tenera TaxID=51953 RepID=UPI00057B3D03
MSNLARAAWNQAWRLATTIAGAPKNGSFRDPLHGFPFINYKRFSTLESQANEGLIPPELLTSRTVLMPDRVIVIVSNINAILVQTSPLSQQYLMHMIVCLI